MKTAYAVVEMQYEYDDNRYNSQVYGAPKKVYLNREKALKECEQMLQIWFSNHEVSDYTYDTGVFSEEGRKKLIELLPMISTHNEIEIEDSSDVSFEEYSRIFRELVISTEWSGLSDILKEVLVRPYQVIEVELEE